MRTLKDFHPYQKRAVEKMLDNQQGALFLDVGLGKTAIALTVIEQLTDQLDIQGCLVLAPKRVCEATWMQEAQEWAHTCGLRFSKILGTPKQRTAALESDADIYLMNYENLKWLVRLYFKEVGGQIMPLEGKTLPFNMIVMDELSLVANAQAIRSQVIKVFSEVGGCDRRMGLTATPASNGLFKMFGEFLALDRGERLGRSAYAFNARYCYEGYDGKMYARPRAKDDIFEKVKDITYSAGHRDHLPMEEPLIQDVWCGLGSARDIYEQMEKQFFAELPRGETLKALNAGAMTNKCLQIANGTAYLDPESDGYSILHTEKLDALEDIVEQMQGNPLLVCYSYKMDRWEIAKRFGGRAKDVRDFKKTEDCMNEWNAGRIEVLTGHPASMGHGLNLQKPCHHMVWYGLTWNLEHYEQAIGRIWRQGQRNRVIIKRLVASGTLDTAVMERLESKATTQRDMLSILQNYEKRNAAKLAA